MARASRMVFISTSKGVEGRVYNFEWFMGLAISQLRKSIRSLHSEIRKSGIHNVLEVSRKSEDEIGNKLSAFNLLVEINGIKSSVESLYHSSKVFDGDIKFEECIDMTPGDSRKFIHEVIKKDGLTLSGFEFNGLKFILSTKSMCYDYIYILGLVQNKEVGNELIKYDCFTDIVFNQNKSVACQARTCAMYKYLRENNLLDKYLNNPFSFDYLYKAY